MYQQSSEEFEKLASRKSWTKAIIGSVLGGAGALALLGYPKKRRAQLRKELRDPRLYSNLRGMTKLESAKQRVAFHKKLKKGRR